MSANPLTIATHEAFAQACVRLETATDAYREVFKPEPHVSNVAVWSMACRMKARTDVANRIGYLRAEALRHSQVEVVEMIHDLVDIIRADPNELMRSVVVNCRHCHGEEHGYQWDGREYALACEEAAAKNKPEPKWLGGMGWDAMADPHPMCPECKGAGHLHVIVADTTKLSKRGAKLYKGIKIKGNGDREILMHDQMQARDQLHRLVGAYKDSLAIPTLPAAEVKPGADVSKTYLAMVHGKRA